MICENELDATYAVCEVKRDPTRIDLEALKEKFKAFQQTTGKWKPAHPTVTGLSLEDM